MDTHRSPLDQRHTQAHHGTTGASPSQPETARRRPAGRGAGDCPQQLAVCAAARYSSSPLVEIVEIGGERSADADTIDTRF
jgi:hypothetical protein